MFALSEVVASVGGCEFRRTPMIINNKSVKNQAKGAAPAAPFA
jgi:hypothetical protein